MIPKPYSIRIRKLRSKLREQKLTGLLVSKTINIRYLTGFRGDDSLVLVTPTKVIVISDFRYQEEIGKGFPWLHLVVRQKTETVFEIIARLAQKEGLKKIGFESEVVSFDFHKRLRRALKGKVKLLPTAGVVEALRLIKDPTEIRAIQKAAQITDNTLVFLLRKAKVGMSEDQLKLDFEQKISLLGAEGYAFDPIIVSGAKTSQPHALTGKNKLKNGTMLLFDMGSKVKGYHSDLTRTFFAGSISDRFQRVYGAVLEAQTAALSMIRPGVRVSEVDGKAREVLAKHGLAKYFGHSTGHGVGLEIHEAPTVSSKSLEVIREGMVFTLEPGVYIPGWGGIRIEDTVRVTRTGYVALTGFPKKIGVKLKQ